MLLRQACDFGSGQHIGGLQFEVKDNDNFSAGELLSDVVYLLFKVIFVFSVVGAFHVAQTIQLAHSTLHQIPNLAVPPRTFPKIHRPPALNLRDQIPIAHRLEGRGSLF